MSTETLTTLHNDATGRWQVATESSVYLLDLDARTATRRPRPEQAAGVAAPALLREDETPICLVYLSRCRVGEGMLLLLDIVKDGETVTSRHTTAVVSIEPAPGL